MPSSPPPGEPAPADGALPLDALEAGSTRSLGFYVHVPYCATRCGYCDFNTYTAAELGPNANRQTYADQVVEEVRLARRVLGDTGRPVDTVFVGGGTPTLLAAADLGRIVAAISQELGLAPAAEVTTEANPDSVTLESLQELVSVGFTRISFGMQSAVPHVLATLDRTHTPGRVAEVVADAWTAGFEHVSVDLIYGTPGESVADWETSLRAALAAGPDHVSAYGLVVEPGTRLAAQVARGEVECTDPDDQATKYELAERTLAEHGFAWYEISNWARQPSGRCRHNLGYWTGADWWGAGPGAHSHVGGVRWWNVRHPSEYAKRLGAGVSPAQAREQLDAPARQLERVLLESRLSSGLSLDALAPAGRKRVARLVDDGLVEPGAVAGGRVVLTLRGRLLADRVVDQLTP